MKFRDPKSIKTPKIDIAPVIKQRILLQSTQESIKRNFNLYLPDIQSITKPSFLLSYEKWPEEKQKQFLITIGGPINVGYTKYYMKELINKIKKEVWQTAESE